jgi:hypothetical protein
VHEAYLGLLDSIGLISEEWPLMHFASAGNAVEKLAISKNISS